MVLRQQPKNPSKFLKVRDKDLNVYLQKHGYIPLYFWWRTFYYEDIDEIKKIIEGWEV